MRSCDHGSYHFIAASAAAQGSVAGSKLAELVGPPKKLAAVRVSLPSLGHQSDRSLSSTSQEIEGSMQMNEKVHICKSTYLYFVYICIFVCNLIYVHDICGWSSKCLHAEHFETEVCYTWAPGPCVLSNTASP